MNAQRGRRDIALLVLNLYAAMNAQRGRRDTALLVLNLGASEGE
jgi:hypothetical protein